MTWHRRHADCEGYWSSGTPRACLEEAWTDLLEPKLIHFEKLTWADIDKQSSDKGHKLHHAQEVDSLIAEVGERLAELGEYPDVVFRFRLGNTKRLWGVRTLGEFEVIWYDPHHEFYPTELD